MGSDKKEPEAIGDFGFHYPLETLMLAISILKASNYAVWPESGGLLDQDAFMIQDILLWLAIERRLEWEGKPEIDSAISDPNQITESMW